jgi:biotin transport system permease protein
VNQTPSLLGLYRPGRTWLHRLRAGHKLSGLFLLGVVVVVVHGPWTALAALSLGLALVMTSGMDLRITARALRGIALVAVMLGAYQTWQRGWPHAVEAVGDLVALVLAATVLTATTPIDEVLDVIVRLARPFRRFGVDPERIGLAFSLMIRGVPETMELGRETRDAARARGMERNPRVLLTPMVIRVVAKAHATGDALTARGIGDT